MSHAKPTELKRALGNPGRRKLPDEGKVIVLQQLAGQPPAHLSKVQKEKWAELRRLAPWIAVTDEPLLTSLVEKMTRQKELSKKMNQNFIVDNRPGAANIIATEMAAKAIPDGYTLLLGTTGTFVTNPLLYAKLPYSNQSFVPIVNAVNAPFILCIHPQVPATNLTELIAYAKANPDKLSFASFGKGSSNHLAGELFQILTGTKFIHVPYKGGAPGMAALLAGDITMTFDSGLTSIANIQAKKIRPIAVAAQARLSELPDVPTFTEAGLANFHAGSWYGFMAPAGTPIEIVQKLNVQINQVLRTPEITARINQLGSSIVGNTPAEFTRQIALESEVWSSVVKKAGISPE